MKSRVVDDQNKPVAAASVYINNTTYGVLSNEEGFFELVHFPEPPFQLSVSCIGYSTASVTVTSREQQLTIVLKLKVSNLDEFVVLSPEKDGWAKFGEDFKRDFIGYSAFADQTQILNKEVLEFVYDEQQMKLYVSAKRPLKIRNKATGYLLTFWLDDYSKDYTANKVFFKGTAQFEAMSSTKEKRQKRWNQNRLSAYQGSLNHFMRSVYRDSVYEEGFELRVYQRLPTEEYGEKIPCRTDTVYQYTTDSAIFSPIINFLRYSAGCAETFKKPLQQWLHDTSKSYIFTLSEKQNDSLNEPQRHLHFGFNPSEPRQKWIQYFDHTRKLADTFYENGLKKFQLMTSGQDIPMPLKPKPAYFAHLWTAKMPLDSFVVRSREGTVQFLFKDYLDITYNRETLEQAYIDSKRRPKPLLTDLQQSLLHLEHEEGITILPDGNYYDPYNLLVEDYWSYEKLDKMLPLDFEPGR